ncbi:NlpC/P60 family protein [Yinghuangia sp. ASG 101]|uniref:C40 family peptidase n=1 Tax=Yinghuangia sp. ASG 101 TaxID=2896848 RepID=UPI001E50FBE2|nr:NlpC/P60 family protein [Yinghuangia sp. ASG 101]UGQ10359.1 NlpC/P60 family protein [Yinghuangia sp. ASG 101]
MKPGRAITGFLVLPFLLLLAGLLVIAALAGGLPAGPGITPAGNGVFVSGNVPPQYREIISRVGNQCPELSPTLLAAQMEQESGWQSSVESHASAKGVAQFIDATWASFGTDGDGDGRADVTNGVDAIASAARYDCYVAGLVRPYVEAGQVRGNVQDLMLAAYNAGPDAVIKYSGVPPYEETKNYIRSIRTLMDKYQVITPAVAAGTPFGAAVVTFAMEQRGLPYSWGGGTVDGPSTGFGPKGQVVGFDCSGLVLYAVYQASGGKVTLPRVSQRQVTVGQAVPRDLAQMRPGDVIGFDPKSSGDFSHIGIYIGDGQMVHAPKPGDVVKVSPLSEYAGVTWSVRRYG